MQESLSTGTFQGCQHSQGVNGSSLGQGQHQEKRRSYLQIQMWPTRVYHWVHRGDWQKCWWKVQGASQDPLPIFNHSQPTGDIIKLDNFIMSRESQGITRTIREAMYIRVNDPSSNRNLGKYRLSYIWMECCRTCQLAFTVKPYSSHTTNPLWAIPNIRGYNILPWDKYLHPGVPSALPILQLVQIPPLW